MTKDIADPLERESQIWVIRRDWNRRSKWMEEGLRVRDPTFFAELVNGMNEAMKQCWIEALQGDNSNARVFCHLLLPVITLSSIAFWFLLNHISSLFPLPAESLTGGLSGLEDRTGSLGAPSSNHTTEYTEYFILRECAIKRKHSMEE